MFIVSFFLLSVKKSARHLKSTSILSVMFEREKQNEKGILGSNPVSFMNILSKTERIIK